MHDGEDAAERAMLSEVLDRYRDVVERKVGGLSFEQATSVSTSTGMTLLGVVQHLSWVERVWFAHHFRGEQADDLDADTSFGLGADDTVESVLGRYREACAASRRIVADASLGAAGTIPHWAFGIRDMRWILVHMIEETARHAGHLDILREMTDGPTGV